MLNIISPAVFIFKFVIKFLVNIPQKSKLVIKEYLQRRYFQETNGLRKKKKKKGLLFHCPQSWSQSYGGKGT